MALISIPTDQHHHIKLRKTISFEKKPLMLKDYLLRDDLSSCSSSGFRSFPRQHCCTTVRFLLEAEFKKTKDNYSTTTEKLLKRSRSKPGAAAVSALQRASEVVLNAVKLLPSSSMKRNSPWKKRRFARNIFRRNFWKKAHHNKEDDRSGDQFRRCKLFREFLEEKNQPSDDQNKIISDVNVNAIDNSVSTITTSRVSTDMSSYSCGETEFTADGLQSSSGNSESSSENEVVEGKCKSSLPHEEKVSDKVGAKVVEEDSINFTKEQDWPNEEGKEQFSPVSILDCPFNDEDEEEDNSSHFEENLHVEGTKQKVRRFDNLAQLEPVDLEKRIAMTELQEDDESSSLESHDELLKLLKMRIPSEIFNAMDDILLLDFIRETLMVEDKAELLDVGFEVFGVKCLKVLEDWVYGNNEELVLGWEMQVYLKEMERNENWRNFNEEKEDVGLMVDFEVYDSLVDELLSDLF